MVVLRKTVGFVPDILEKSETPGVTTEAERLGFTRDKEFFITFCERDRDGWRDAKNRKSFHHGVELSFSSIDQQQIGKRFTLL